MSFKFVPLVDENDQVETSFACVTSGLRDPKMTHELFLLYWDSMIEALATEPNSHLSQSICHVVADLVNGKFKQEELLDVLCGSNIEIGDTSPGTDGFNFLVEFSDHGDLPFFTFFCKHLVDSMVGVDLASLYKGKVKEAPSGLKSKLEDYVNHAGESIGDKLRHVLDDNLDLEGEMSKVFSMPRLFARAFTMASSTFAKDMLRMIAKAPPSDIRDLLKVLPLSGFEFPAVQLPSGNADSVLDKAVLEYKPDPLIDELLVSVANEGSAKKSFLEPQEIKHAPITIVVADPSDAGGSVAIFNGGCVLKTSNKNIAFNVMSERVCTKAVMDVIKREGASIPEDAKKNFFRKNAYVVESLRHPLPAPAWQRYTIKLDIDNKKSTALHKNIRSIQFYPLRSGKGSGRNEEMAQFKINHVPMFSYGSDRPSLYFVLLVNKDGRDYFSALESGVKVGKYKELFVEAHEGYANIMRYSLNRASGNVDLVTTIQHWGTKGKAIKDWWVVHFIKDFLKVLAHQQGLRRVIQDEMALGGVHQLPGVVKLLSLVDKPKVVSLNALGILAPLGCDIVASDNMRGQTIRGEHIGFKFDQQVDSVVVRFNNMVSMDVRHKYDSTDLELKIGSYNRSGYVTADPNHVLVDLTIPGAIFTPQSDRNKNADTPVEYKGDRLLFDTPRSKCIYTPANLGIWRGFMVYVPFFQLGGGDPEFFKGLSALDDTHEFFLCQTGILSYCGAYVVGHRMLIPPRDGGIRSGLSFKEMRLAMVASCAQKMLLFCDLYTHIPTNYERIYETNMKFLDSIACDEYMKTLRSRVMNLKGYIDLMAKGDKQGKDYDAALLNGMAKFAEHFKQYSGGVSKNDEIPENDDDFNF